MPNYPQDYPLVCFKGIDQPTPYTLESYQARAGYAALQKVIDTGMAQGDILAEVKASGLRGRGGAGFPTAKKWSFMPVDAPQPKYLLCNGDEAEPGTFKDRDIMRYNPHLLIEGMILSGYTIDTTVGYIYIRGEFWEPYVRVQQAVDEAYQAGLLGENILGSGIDFHLHVHRGAGAYIAGEETAMMDSIEGKKALPRFKPPFPAQRGLFGRPTTINNVETLASLPAIVQNGGEWFASLGTPQSGGTKIYSVSGHVNRPGNYEVPMGTPFPELLELAGGVRNGYQLKAVIPGGPSVPLLTQEQILDCTMDFESLSEHGSMLGSGAVIVMDETTDIVKAVQRLAKFFYIESCGQCTPCREGAGWIYRTISRIVNGQGRSEDLELLLDLAPRIEGHTICAFGDALVAPVRSSILQFRGEYEAYLARKHAKIPA